MQLLTQKYGEAKTLKRASFDLARAKFAFLGIEEYASLITDIESIKKMAGNDPGNADLQFLLGQVYEAMPGKGPEACIAYLAGTLHCDEKDIPEFINKAGDNLNQKNAAGVFSRINGSLLDEIIARSANNNQINLLNGFLGNLFLYNTEYAKAIECFDKMINISGANIDALEGIGESYKMTGNISNAIAYLSKARDIANTPGKKFDLSLKLIDALIAGQQFEQALTEISQIKNDSAGDIDTTRLNILCSQCYYGQRDFQRGLTLINEVLEEIATRKNELNDLFIRSVAVKTGCLVALNQYAEALKTLEQALIFDPRNIELIFLKAQIFIEGQFKMDEGKNLITFLNNRRQIDFENKIRQILQLRYDDGNAYFFAAYIHFLINPGHESINGFIEKAESLGLKNENTYPKFEWYLLKGEIEEKAGQKEEAGKNFFEAAKCLYWQAAYSDANKYFQKTIDLNPALNDAFKYNADTQFLLSFKSDPPYNDAGLINKAYDTWHSSPEKIVIEKTNAWHYIVIARIDEVKYKFREINFFEEYWLSVLYAERALVHDSSNYSFWLNLGRFYRNLEMDYNSMSAFEKADVLYPNDEFLKEEKIILQINTGDYEGPLEYLKQLKEKDEGSPNVYSSYHKLWEGYIIFHNEQKLKDAITLFDEVIREVNTNLFAHQMKMISHWYAQEPEEAKKEAKEIIALENRKIYPKEEFTFSWAYFISGNPDMAISILESFNEKGKAATGNLFSLAQFYLYTGQTEKAQSLFDSFIKWTYNKRSLEELFESLEALEFHFKHEKPALYESSTEFRDRIQRWKKENIERIESVSKSTITLEAELINKQAECSYEEGAVPFITIRSGLARVYRSDKKLPDACRIYNELLKYASLFPEANIALGQIEEEVNTSAVSYIKDSKCVEAVAYLHQFEEYDTGKTPKRKLLLSLAHFGAGNKEKSLEHLIAALLLIDKDAELQNQFWAEITVNTYNAALTWNFGHFLKSGIQHEKMPGAGFLEEGMADKFWNVLISRSNVLYPVVTPIAIEISNDLVSAEAGSGDWYVIQHLIPAMRERINQQFGVWSSSVRIRGNEGDLGAGTYIIMLDEIPLVMGTVQAGKLFITGTDKDLQALGVTGEYGLNPVTRKESVWVSAQYKALLDTNNITYLEDPFDYMIAHLETVLTQHLEMFVDIQFCDDYLGTLTTENREVYPADTPEYTKIIREDTSLFLLFHEVLKGLVREQVPIINKAVIIRSFMEAKKNYTDANGLIQSARLELKRALPVNNLPIKSFELAPLTEKNIKEALRTGEGKTFLAMSPEICQEVLLEVRNMAGNFENGENITLITKDPQLRIHLRKLVEIEFPNMMVVAGEELMET